LVKAELTTTEILTVTFRGCKDSAVMLEHPLLGLLVVERSALTALTQLDAAEACAESATSAPPPAAVPEGTDEPEWLVGIELGINGALGNSESYDLRFSAHAERKSSNGELLAEITYVRAEAASKSNTDTDGDGIVDSSGLELTDSKILASARNDWLFVGNRWRYFLQATTDIDEFKDYDLRWALSTGPGYTFFSTPDSTLVGRFGAGLSQKVGGEDQSIVPELVFGSDWKHALSKRQRLGVKLTVYPDLSEFGELRSVAKGTWDIDIDPEHNLTLRLGVEDRYDSKPEDEIISVGTNTLIKRTEHNDIDYYATLLFEF